MDPKRVPVCMGGELSLPLIDETFTPPVSEKLGTFTPEVVTMILQEIQQKQRDHGIIHPLNQDGQSKRSAREKAMEL